MLENTVELEKLGIGLGLIVIALCIVARVVSDPWGKMVALARWVLGLGLIGAALYIVVYVASNPARETTTHVVFNPFVMAAVAVVILLAWGVAILCI